MRPDPPPERVPAGLYLHFPFCCVRCSYCDFATTAGRDDRIEDYLRALETEIGRGQPDLPPRVDTLYFGGGTPSRMTAEQVARLLAAVERRFELAADHEITLEGNPESLTTERLRGYREAGITRISVGVQSLDDRVLAGVGRAHGAAEALEAVRRAAACRFPEINVDLIAGLPGERLGPWPETVRAAAGSEVDHVSVYLLETDKDTPLGRAVRGGRAVARDDDELAEAYLRTVAVLEGLGLAQYEISNFSRPGHPSRHNLKYWEDAPYGGFGLGAHGYAAGRRRANRRDLDGYVREIEAGRDPVEFEDPWQPRRRLGEAVILGLRKVEGIDLVDLGERYEADVERLFERAWARADAAGMLVRRGTRLALSAAGRLRSNELFAELL